MKLQEETYDAYCLRDTVKILHSEALVGNLWKKMESTQQSLRLVSVEQGMTNGDFHLIDPATQSYVADQQNERFRRPMPDWAQRDGTIELPQEQVFQDKTALVIGGMKNHWHFLINFLPRLIMAHKIMGGDFHDVDYIVIHETTPAQQEFLERLFPDIVFYQIPQGDSTAYAFSTLYYLDLPRNLVFCSDILSATRMAVLDAYAPLPQAPNDIFVDRNPDIPRRRLFARQNKLPILEAHKVTPIFCEDYNFADQVALFYNAGLLAGLHGAGMANMLFCQPGTPVLIVDYKWPSEMYGLARSLGLKPLPLLAEIMPDEAVEPRLRDLRVTPKQMDAALTALKDLVRLE